MSTNRAGTFLGGLLVGAIAGTVTGLLIAPRTGRETRKLLKHSADTLPELADELTTTVQTQADRLSESALRSWECTLDRLREAVAAGVEASQEAARSPEPKTMSVSAYTYDSPEPMHSDHAQN